MLHTHELLPAIRVLVKAALTGQNDKKGVSKYEHCIRVEQRTPQIIVHEGIHMAPYEIADFQAVSLLHDIIEDSDLEAEDLLIFGIPPHIVEAVKLLTHDDSSEEYFTYIENLCTSGNLLALVGKLADNFDNNDPARLEGLPEDFRIHLHKRYGGVRERLISALEPFKRITA